MGQGKQKGSGKNGGKDGGKGGSGGKNAEVRGPHPNKYCHHCQVYGHHTYDCFHKKKIDQESSDKSGGKGTKPKDGGKGGKHKKEQAKTVLEQEPPRIDPADEEQMFAMVADLVVLLAKSMQNLGSGAEPARNAPAVK